MKKAVWRTIYKGRKKYAKDFLIGYHSGDWTKRSSRFNIPGHY